MNTKASSYPRYQYKKSPLQEAIFEARFSVEDFDVTVPGRFFDRVCDQFPNKNDLSVITYALGTTASQQQEPPFVQAPVMQAWNEDHTSCLQMGPGIVAANDTTYARWQEFTGSIELLLTSYLDCAKPFETKKVGFRGINRFLIPDDSIVITDYFRLGLALPETLLGSSGFDVTLIKEFQDGVNAKVRFASDSLRPHETGIAVLLDIEAFVTKGLSTDPKEILERAAACRAVVKDILESSLRDKMRVLLEGVPS